MTQPAYIYARFSSLEQSRNDSVRRQLEGGRAFIERMGWEHSPNREIIDEGKSAYYGANRSAGSLLHDFEQKAKDGLFNNGAVLVVENLDRLTRQGYEEAIDLLRALTTSGVTVATWHDNQTYEAGQRIDMMKVMSIILKAELAREESEKKSIRIRASWTKKIEAAMAGDRRAMTKILPAWLRRDDVTMEMVVIPHRAAVVNEIFDWYIEGRGLPWIVKQLNERREGSWAYGIKDRGQGWNTAYLHKILTNRAVTGEFEPMSRPRSVMYEMTKGIVIPDYFPQVIPHEKFNRVQQLRAMRAKWGGSATKSMNNLLSGIAKCAHCGSSMYYISEQKVGRPTRHRSKVDGRQLEYVAKTERSSFRCNSNRRGHTCSNKTRIRYETLERALLDCLFDLAMKDSTFKPSDAVSHILAEIAQAERAVELKRQQVEQGTANLLEFHSKALAQKIAGLEAELDADENVLQALRKRLEIERGTMRPEQDAELLLEARDALNSDNADDRYAARVKTHQSLMRLIDTMVCDDRGETHITLTQSDVHIIIQPDGYTSAIIYQGPDGEDGWHPEQEAAE